jgi:hypothetical protein
MARKRKPAPAPAADPVADLLASVEKPRVREWLGKFFEDKGNTERRLRDVLTDLLRSLASDPEEDEWNEWARKMLAANTNPDER